MRTGLLICAVSVVCLSMVTGCCSYYRITEPGSGKVYYTDDIDEEGDGAIRFKDSVTRRVVTLQQSEVLEIMEDQFRAAGKTRETE